MYSLKKVLQTFEKLSRVMDHVEENYNYRYVFLTLTVKNCYGENLGDTLDLMTKAFNTMTRRKVFKQVVKGYFRCFEVTYDKDKDTYHPHFHTILAVNDSYFNDPKYYLSQNDWTELWKSCLKVNYTPIVDVRIIKENRDKDFGKVVAETAKYIVKPEDFDVEDYNDEMNEDMASNFTKIVGGALHRKRLTYFGLTFNDAHKQVNYGNDVEKKLIKIDNGYELRKDLLYIVEEYDWNIGIRKYSLKKDFNVSHDLISNGLITTDGIINPLASLSNIMNMSKIVGKNNIITNAGGVSSDFKTAYTGIGSSLASLSNIMNMSEIVGKNNIITSTDLIAESLLYSQKACEENFIKLMYSSHDIRVVSIIKKILKTGDFSLIKYINSYNILFSLKEILEKYEEEIRFILIITIFILTQKYDNLKYLNLLNKLILHLSNESDVVQFVIRCINTTLGLK